jgi:Conserved protein/domain typically associated with flavoprotein oxygenases, DIM6/NTAB family
MKMQYLNSSDWEGYPGRIFAAWFNQLEGARSPVLVGSRSLTGVDNLAIFNSLTHIGARPPLLALVFRPLSVERHTYDNIQATDMFTINHISGSMVDAAHQTSAKYPEEVSEFKACGLTPERTASGVAYVAESPVSMLLEKVEEHKIAANDTVLLVGAVREIRLIDQVAFTDERLSLESLDLRVVSGLYDYYGLNFDKRKAYAKP